MTIHCAECAERDAGAGASDVRARPKFYCFVYDHGHWEAREVKAGPDERQVLRDRVGLNEGDQVAMNPRAYLARCELCRSCRRKKCSAPCRSRHRRARRRTPPKPSGEKVAAPAGERRRRRAAARLRRRPGWTRPGGGRRQRRRRQGGRRTGECRASRRARARRISRVYAIDDIAGAAQ